MRWMIAAWMAIAACAFAMAEEFNVLRTRQKTAYSGHLISVDTSNRLGRIRTTLDSSENLKALWPFDYMAAGGTGGTVDNYLSYMGLSSTVDFNFSQAVATAKPTWQANNGGRISFDGSLDVLTAGESLLDDAGSGFTISAWVMALGTAAARTIWSDVDIQSGGSNDGTWCFLGGANDDRRPVFDIYDSGTANRIRATVNAGAGFKSNVWVNVTCVWDGNFAATGLKVYINGQQAADTDSTAGTVNSFDDSPETFSIGASEVSGGTDAQYDQYFYGHIGEVRVYKVALASNLIYQTYLDTKGVY